MKVLIIEPYMGFRGGSATVVYNLAKYLVKRGVKTTILTLTSREDYDGLDIILPSPDKQVPYHIRTGNISSLIEIYKMIRILNEMISKNINDFDIVNTHNTPAVWSLPTIKKPVIWMCNEIPDFWHTHRLPKIVDRIADIGRFVDKKNVRKKVSKAVVADEANAHVFNSRYGWWPEIIPYGIEGEFFAEDTDKATEEVLRRRFGLHDNTFYIVHAAMISPSKKQFDLLESLQKIKGTLSDVKIVFAGLYEESYYKKLLDSYIRQNNLENKVVFTGHISKSELRTLYKAAHMAVFSGKGQGSWLGPFEALCVGKPIVVSDKLPCSKLIKKENLGIVSDILDEAIIEVYNHYKQYLEKTFYAKKFVLKNMTYEKFGERFLNLLKKQMESPT